MVTRVTAATIINRDAKQLMKKHPKLTLDEAKNIIRWTMNRYSSDLRELPE